MRKLIILFILLLTIVSLKAQTVTIQKDSISFSKILTLLEDQSEYEFFYAPEWVENMQFNANYKNEKIENIINWLSTESKLPYKIIKKNVIFTKGHNLKTNYAAEYIQYLANQKITNIDTLSYKAPKVFVEKEVKISEEYQLFTLGNRSLNSNKKKAIISGTIKDIETGEPLIGAMIYIKELKNGTVTNLYGSYSFSLSPGKYKVEYRMVGMRTTTRNVYIHSDGVLNVNLKSKPTSLKEVVVTAKTEDPVRNLRMGMEKITIKTLKQLPLGMGEADIIKSTLLLPGVQSVGEASSGINVRGGNTDQNLILLNEAPIINTSHFFGFFSGFNSEIIKDISLYKSGVPAKYGGRTSSVMDITLKEGNRKKHKLSGGISPAFGKLTLEGPLVKDKVSFILGARTTYSDWVLKLLNDAKLKKSKASFYDLQGNLSWDIDSKNSLYLSGYYSGDKFDYYTENAFDYETFASTLKWKHTYSPKLYSTISAVVSNYKHNTKSVNDPLKAHSTEYRFNQYNLKSDFSYNTSNNHKIDFGLQSTYYELWPGKRVSLSDLSTVPSKELEKEQAIELAAYISDEFDLTSFMSISAGIRYSFYGNLGPKSEYLYNDNETRNSESIKDTIQHNSGFITKHSGPEIRISSNIRTGASSSIKLSYNRMNQYINMISNTASMTPTDIWKLSDKYIQPQKGDQYSIGFYKKINQNAYEVSVETYYKKLKNILDYKGGAILEMSDHLETEVINGKGKAYGIEFMLQKKTGKLTGWINYTYSKILHKIDSKFIEENVNDGKYYPANYDKPHDFKFVANYKVSRRLNVSSNLSVSTGRPFTPPVAYYNFEGSDRVFYSDRNSMRMPDYVRLDLAATVNGNLVAKKLNHSSWTFAVYNILGRQNAYNVFFRTEGKEIKGYKMSIFAKPIFTVTYNFKLFGNAKDDF